MIALKNRGVGPSGAQAARSRCPLSQIADQLICAVENIADVPRKILIPSFIQDGYRLELRQAISLADVRSSR